jgi:hypothetical protein
MSAIWAMILDSWEEQTLPSTMCDRSWLNGRKSDELTRSGDEDIRVYEFMSDFALAVSSLG